MKSGRTGWHGSINESRRAAQGELEQIRRDGMLHATSGSRRKKPMLKNNIDAGTYAPEKELVDVCLQCPKKQCRTGNCARIMDAKRKKLEERRHA